jgi:hypothetical protein
MARGEVHADCGAEGDARDMRLLDPDGAEERGDLVGVRLGRVRPGGLVALAGAGQVDGDAPEVPARRQSPAGGAPAYSSSVR